MAQKNSKKQYWTCEHGCTLTKNPCKHLERKLDNPNKGHLSRHFLDTNKEVVTTEEYSETSDIEYRLYSYGLVEHEVELLMDRYVAKLNLKEIADKEGYLNKQKVWRLLQDITARLKKSPEFKKMLVNLIKEKR